MRFTFVMFFLGRQVHFSVDGRELAERKRLKVEESEVGIDGTGEPLKRWGWANSRRTEEKGLGQFPGVMESNQGSMPFPARPLRHSMVHALV